MAESDAEVERKTTQRKLEKELRKPDKKNAIIEGKTKRILRNDSKKLNLK